ncbi:fungal hydrophobin [Paecilomyces variotii]|nr:fungal hydrophobin [Paecilomyces variotii]
MHFLIPLSTALFAISATALPANHILSARDGCDANAQAHCCETIANTDDTNVASTLSKIGVSPEEAKGPVGLTCTPITTLGEVVDLGTRCNSNAVCCSNNTYNGLINFGCIPINLNIL